MRRFEHKVTMMYKVLNNNAPAYLQEQFKQLKDSVPYNLRNADVNLALPKPNSEYLKKALGIVGRLLGTHCQEIFKTRKLLTSLDRI